MSTRRKPRQFSARLFRWLLTLYPPFVFQRIRVVSLEGDYSAATVRVSKSLLNRNLNGTIFGGTIFSAADPIYAVMLWQRLARQGIAAKVWLRSGEVRYTAPAGTALTLRFELPGPVVEEAVHALRAAGRFDHRFTIEAVDREERVCAVIETEVALRADEPEQRSVSEF